ncbi:MAG TPA: hypothetical protein VH934_08335 [Xanthobacteraceae bacterium]|jgi:hypothetical protein
MPNVLTVVALGTLCLMSLAHPSLLAAQEAADQKAQGNASIYNLDRDAGTGGVAIDGPIDKSVASHAIELMKSIRPDVNELMIYLDSSGGDPVAAMELGEEIRKQWALTVVDDEAECLGACVLVLAAGVRRSPAADKVGLYRPSFDAKEPAHDRSGKNAAALTKKMQIYLAHMGMPDRLFKEMMQRPPGKALMLDGGRLKALGLEGVYPAYEQWLRANANQQPPRQSN